MTRINLSLIIMTALLLFACTQVPATTDDKAVPSKEVSEVTNMQETGESVEVVEMENPAESTAPTSSSPASKSDEKAVAQKSTGSKATSTAPQKPQPIITKPAPTTGEPILNKPPRTTATPPTEAPVLSPPPRPKNVGSPKKPASKKPMLSHDGWDALLRKYVSNTGKVNYASLKANKPVLNSYLQVLTDNPPQNDWSRGKTIAYWINVYNAFTVKLIVDNYPVKSIMDLDGGNPWAKKWVKIGNKTLSLNEIEKDYLIKAFKEPRVHFAVNCAAKSCPPLLNRAWTAGNLEANFERQAKSFINNDNFNSITTKSAQLSKIFEWYSADFGNLVGFVNKYAEERLSEKTKISYKEYNWGLNE